MSDAREGSKPIPVMSIPAGLADLLETCAKNGNVLVGDKKDQSLSSVGLMAAMVDPKKSIPAVQKYRDQIKLFMRDPTTNNLEAFLLRDAQQDRLGGPFAFIAAILLLVDWAHLLGDDRACTMVIVNKSNTPLKFDQNSFNGGDYHGKQTGHPGTLNGKDKSFTDEYIIPAANNDDGMQFYGLGMFKFQKSEGFMGLGWYGTQGAIGASLTGSNALKISFLVGQSGKTAIAVSTDTQKLGDFLEANWSPDNSIVTTSASSSAGSALASLYPAAGLYLNEDKDHTDMAATVIFSPT